MAFMVRVGLFVVTSLSLSVFAYGAKGDDRAEADLARAIAWLDGTTDQLIVPLGQSRDSARSGTCSAARSVHATLCVRR